MIQTANGSLTTGLDLREGQTLLIRGGTSSVGLAAAVLAKQNGATVLATTRRPERTEDLTAAGVDHLIVDTGEIAAAVREIVHIGLGSSGSITAHRLTGAAAHRHRHSRIRQLVRVASPEVRRLNCCRHRLIGVS